MGKFSIAGGELLNWNGYEVGKEVETVNTGYCFQNFCHEEEQGNK